MDIATGGQIRDQNWDILGQDHLKRLLEATFATGELAHAYLLAGPSGIGKQKLAVEIARRLLCSGDDPRRQCSSCRWLVAGEHPDFRVVNPEGAVLKIAEIRRLKEEVGFRPVRGERRVFLLRTVEKLTNEAANAFLKLLEEPPPGTFFLLTTDVPSQVKATLFSRTLFLPFRPVPREELADWLQKELPIPEAEAHNLARRAGGVPGKAMALYGLAGRTEVEREILITIRDGGGKLLDLASRLAKEATLGLEELEKNFRYLMTEGIISPDFGAKGLLGLEKARRQLGQNLNRELIFESLLLSLKHQLGVLANGRGSRGKV